MHKLFKSSLINEKLENFEIPDLDHKIQILQNWHKLYQSWTLTKKSEQEVEQSFNEDILGKILGYKSLTESQIYHREAQPKAPVGWQKADFGLGFFDSQDPENNKIQAVVEVKDAATSLDKPQKREWNLSPVQQAFKYKPFFKDCHFIIVSNFWETRLYTDSYYEYEAWTIADLLNPENNYQNFRQFYYILSQANLISPQWESQTKKLLSDVIIQSKEITKKFYEEYKALRLELLRDLIKKNLTPEEKKDPAKKKAKYKLILEKWQKIIDRIVFIHFCEDLGLLPAGKLKEYVRKASELDFRPWELIQRYFRAVDTGSEKIWIPDGYNGWLFAIDHELRALEASDEICEKFVDLGDYDFAEDLSVNILGHIFEQSISDLEELKEKIDNNENLENKVSKRKQDGIFYTPEYIVDYIVKNSVWKYLEEQFEQIAEEVGLKEDIQDKNYEKRLYQTYSQYQKKLQSIKVLDPACGSGAFLVKVFDYLLAENVRVFDVLSGGKEWLFDKGDLAKDILQNNIYGVDLNKESVEISKLSLWLKTAQKGKKLANLDENIKCGNSLIDDPEVAGEKAFDWEKEFGGSFDVVVGNPPYVSFQSNVLSNDEISFFENNYKTTYKIYDLYALFIEKSINLLKSNWILSFINPSVLLTNNSFWKLREFMTEKWGITEISNLKDWVFKQATVPTMIFIFYKDCKNNFVRINVSKDSDIVNIRTIESNDFYENPFEWFNIIIDTISKQIISKSKENSLNLGDILWIRESIKTWNDKEFISNTKKSSNSFPIVTWKDMNRYILNQSRYIEFIPEKLSRPTKLEYFRWEKLFIRRVWNGVIATYDKDENLSTHVLYIWNLINEEFNLKYVLVLLNSKFITYVYSKLFPPKWNVFPEIRIWNLRELPIPNISPEEQKPFIAKADFMLEKNKELNDKINTTLEFLQTRFEIDKPSKKLQQFWELDFAEFKKALKIKKMPMSEEEELLTWFKSKQNEILDLKSQIDECDREIDEMVFDLYGLSEEERRVILDS